MLYFLFYTSLFLPALHTQARYLSICWKVESEKKKICFKRSNISVVGFDIRHHRATPAPGAWRGACSNFRWLSLLRRAPQRPSRNKPFLTATATSSVHDFSLHLLQSVKRWRTPWAASSEGKMQTLSWAQWQQRDDRRGQPDLSCGICMADGTSTEDSKPWGYWGTVSCKASHSARWAVGSTLVTQVSSTWRWLVWLTSRLKLWGSERRFSGYCYWLLSFQKTWVLNPSIHMAHSPLTLSPRGSEAFFQPLWVSGAHMLHRRHAGETLTHIRSNSEVYMFTFVFS